MKLTFHGAARSVTGSRHLLEANGFRVLLDCGLVQGRRDEAEKRNRSFPFDPGKLDAVVLSHAHIDHSGAIPAIVRHGFDGAIHSTLATADLCSYMLRDSASLQERDVEWVNKRLRKRAGGKVHENQLRQPLYTIEDAEKSMELFEGHRYYRRFPVVPGVDATFYDAGHILGSAIVVLDIEEDGAKRSVVFSGDLGRPGMAIVRDPDDVPANDIVIMETTYGGRVHAPNAEVEQKLADLFIDNCKRRGKLIIPAFSVGRTQELVFDLAQMMRSGRIPSCPIYVDSPLAVRITDVFDRHPECYDQETRKVLRDTQDPFGFELIRYVRSVEESKALNDADGPFTIISASGMMEGGRVLHHLRNSIENPNNSILIVGYQAEHTLGNRILHGADPVNIFGEPHALRAKVHVMNEFSAHADRDELLQWHRGNQGKPRQTFLVHGEEEQIESFAELLRSEGHTGVEVPALDQTFALGGRDGLSSHTE